MESQSSSSTPPPKALVPVGSYRLEVGAAADTFALFTPQAEEANANGLAQALSAEAEEQAGKTADLLEGPLDDASSVTAGSERSLSLFNSIAAGKALDPNVVSQELDAALALLTRLDRSGRHKEVLRLARDLCALYALLLRWLELVRTLRLALATAQTIGDDSARAWALHELGSLHLAAGQPKTAAKYLHQAEELQQKMTGQGRCATRHNLDAAERDTAGQDVLDKARRRRRMRWVGAGAAILLLGTGGTALGVRGPHHTAAPPATNQPTTNQPTTTTTPSTTTQPTTVVVDTTGPALKLTAPAAQSSVATQSPTFTGTGGLAAGDLATITLTVSTAGGTQVEQLTAKRDGASGAFSVPSPNPLAEGSYTAVATQRDQHGNVGTASVSFTVDLTSPVVTFTSPKDGTTTDTVPTFVGTAGSLAGDDQTITVTITKTDGVTPAEVLRDIPVVDGQWKAQATTGLGQGSQYEAVVSQSDEAGNTGSNKISFSVASPIQ